MLNFIIQNYTFLTTYFKKLILKGQNSKKSDRYDLCITDFSQKPKTYPHHKDVLSLFLLPYKLVI